MIVSMTADTAHRSKVLLNIKKYIAAFVLGVSLIACSTPSALAEHGPGKIDDPDHYDARVQGYDPDVELPAASSGFCWVMLIFCGVICVAVIFKDAKRSHLD
jgi:hypothetical protein